MANNPKLGAVAPDWLEDDLGEAAPLAPHKLIHLRRFPAVVECTMPTVGGDCDRTECRYHLRHRAKGDHRLNPTRDCSLAAANEGPRTLAEIADVLGMSAERVRKIEDSALEKLGRDPLVRKLCEDILGVGREPTGGTR